jgi:hypothetical protein
MTNLIFKDRVQFATFLTSVVFWFAELRCERKDTPVDESAATLQSQFCRLRIAVLVNVSTFCVDELM